MRRMEGCHILVYKCAMPISFFWSRFFSGSIRTSLAVVQGKFSVHLAWSIERDCTVRYPMEGHFSVMILDDFSASEA